MMRVWPTVDVLKTLYKADMLSARTKSEYEAARRVSDFEQKVGHLVRAFEFAISDEDLLDDARKGFQRGTPDLHKSTSSKAGTPVYEVRSRTGAAWRGAVICPDDGADAWLIYADRHDRFHSSGPNAIVEGLKSGALGPSQLDLRVRKMGIQRVAAQSLHQQVLDAVIDSLQEIAIGAKGSQISMPEKSEYKDAVIHVSVNKIVDQETDPTEAHEDLSTIRLKFLDSSMSYQTRSELIRLIAGFLQPDETMIESLYLRDFTLDILVTQAMIMQLLGLGKERTKGFEAIPPKPKVLHYGFKSLLTEAYVQGSAVQAVCGQWWVPIGDAQTHPDLPVCSKCEAEEPWAQAISNLKKSANPKS